MISPGSVGPLRPAGCRTVARPDWAAQCEVAARLLQDDPSGPLDFDLVVVPSAAHQRDLSQRLAGRASGPQVSAGIEFVRANRLNGRLAAALQNHDMLPEDGWRGAGLELGILSLLTDPDLLTGTAQPATPAQRAALAPLIAHLGAPGDRPGRAYTTARWLAVLFRRYAHQHPEMIARWRAGRDEGPDGEPLADRDLWQPALWRSLRSLLGPDPAERLGLVLNHLSDGRVPDLPGRVIVLQIDDPPPGEQRVLDALARHHQVHLITMAGVPSDPSRPGSVFLRHHASRIAPSLPDTIGTALPPGVPSHASATLLEQVQDEIRHDRSPRIRAAADSSLQIHACHGAGRQVEVLRDLLCGLFSDDPTLQPRDVVVLCPSMDEYAPLISASFCLDATDDAFHPGHRLRAQIAAGSQTAANPVLSVLTSLFQLHAGRATSVDLLDLCQSPPVAERFGFTTESLDRLHELVSSSGIRWGTDGEQRKRNGVRITQSTWLTGVQRMLISLALADQPPVAMGTVTPVPGVEGSDSRLVGQLAELVSRVRKILMGFGDRALATVWVERLREAIELLVEVPVEQQWQLTQALTELAGLQEQATDHPALLEAGDVVAWLTDRQRATRMRPNYGNGSLLFTGLDDMACIDKRVICILGLDDANFPGAPVIDGDDLLARPDSGFRGHWTQQRRELRRQRLLDALMAARDGFIVITQGADEATGQVLPTPVCVSELIEACAVHGPAGEWRGATGAGALVTWHPLHPHGWSDFVTLGSERSASFDRQGLQGARALADPDPQPAAPLWQLQHQISVAPEVDIEELISFFTNPARELLRQATGTTRSSFTRELQVSLPLDQSPKAIWPVGNALFELLVAGNDSGQARNSVWLSGQVLPGKLGEPVVNDQLAAAEQVASAARQARDGALMLVDCDVEVAGRRVQGRVAVHGARVVVQRFGHLKADHTLAGWLRLVLLAASGKDMPGLEALLVGKRCHRLAAPEPQLARRLLGEMVQVREAGLRQVLPLPLRTAAACADLLNWKDGEPLQRAGQAFADEDANWAYFFPSFDELLRPGPAPGDPVAGASDRTSRFEALSGWLLAPITTRLSPWRPGREQS